jgi:S-adenosylhomocysteine hydrolase
MSRKLPLLEVVSGIYKDTDLREVILIACQHLLGTTVDLFDSLIEKGLKPENVYIIGKCYSTDRRVVDVLRARGMFVSPDSESFNSSISFDEQFQSYIDFFIRNIKIDFAQCEKIIVLDDGGHLLLYLNDFLKNSNKIVGIEQTSSGYNRLHKIDLKFPVINVARSQVKLEVESPIIAQALFNKLESYIQLSKVGKTDILVVGLGYIGSFLLKLLKETYLVTGIDSIELHTDISKYNFIIGATGECIIHPGDFSRLNKKVFLASVSSSDREFSASYLRTLAPQSTDCHKDVVVNGITLLNGGFPINFDQSESECGLAPDKIQLTRALLFAGVCQSLTETGNGFKDLDKFIQDKLVSEFKPYFSY